jgi:chaperonin GroES
LLFDNISDFGRDAAAQDYSNVLDDPEADFEKDFSRGDLDIRPVSDPASITRMQKMAKAQFILGLMPQIVTVGGDGREVVRRVLEAVDEEDIDKLLPPPKPPDPQQAQLQLESLMQNLRLLSANADKAEATTQSHMAKAMLDAARAAQERFKLSTTAGEHGVELGVAAGHLQDPAA